MRSTIPHASKPRRSEPKPTWRRPPCETNPSQLNRRASGALSSKRTRPIRPGQEQPPKRTQGPAPARPSPVESASSKRTRARATVWRAAPRRRNEPKNLTTWTPERSRAARRNEPEPDAAAASRIEPEPAPRSAVRRHDVETNPRTAPRDARAIESSVTKRTQDPRPSAANTTVTKRTRACPALGARMRRYSRSASSLSASTAGTA